MNGRLERVWMSGDILIRERDEIRCQLAEQGKTRGWMGGAKRQERTNSPV